MPAEVIIRPAGLARRAVVPQVVAAAEVAGSDGLAQAARLMDEAFVLNDLTATSTPATNGINPWRPGDAAGIRRRVPFLIGGRQYRGDFIEGSRSNYARQTSLGGAVAGVVGSGGAFPTGWAPANDWASGTRTVSLGTDSVGAYMDIRFQGTSSVGSGSMRLGNNSTNGIPSVIGDVVSVRYKTQVIAQSNLSHLRAVSAEYDSGGGYLTEHGSTPFAPVTGALYDVSYQFTNANASCAYADGRFAAGHTGVYDYTIRVYADSVQTEKGAFSSSIIRTTSAAVTRGADSLSFTLAASLGLYEGTAVVLHMPYGHACNTGTYAYLLDGGAVADNVFAIYRGAAGADTLTSARGTVANGNIAAKVAPSGMTLADRAMSSVARTWKSGDNRLHVNGVLVASGAGTTFPADAESTVSVGVRADGLYPAWGANLGLLWPRALTADEIALLHRQASIGGPYL